MFVCLKRGLPCSSGWSQMLHPPASVSWVLASQCSMHCYTLFIRLNPTHQSMQKTWVSCSNHLLSCLFPSLTWCCACLFAAKAKEAMIIVKRRQEASAGFLGAPGSDKTSWASIYPPIWRVRVTSCPHVVICQQGSEDVDSDSISHGFYPLPSSQPLQFSRTDGHEHSPGESPACSSYEFLCIVGNHASFPVISIPLTTSSLSWHPGFAVCFRNCFHLWCHMDAHSGLECWFYGNNLPVLPFHFCLPLYNTHLTVCRVPSTHLNNNNLNLNMHFLVIFAFHFMA